MRVENAVETIEVIKHASGSEQVRVAAAMTTMALVPAALIKSAQAVSNTLRFGVPNPTLFKQATHRLLAPTPPLEPVAQHCLTHLDIIEHGFQIRGDRDCIFVISKQGKLVIFRPIMAIVISDN